MSRIRAKNTIPETMIRRRLRAAGIKGYRIHTDLNGKPDIVFPRARLVIFVDGCFWHKCPTDYQEPSTRREFWIKKIGANVARDRVVNDILTGKGWKVLRFWEREVKQSPEKVVATVVHYLEQRKSRP
jgi:DNA mismatch endonuclease (patch repair protein)